MRFPLVGVAVVMALASPVLAVEVGVQPQGLVVEGEAEIKVPPTLVRIAMRADQRAASLAQAEGTVKAAGDTVLGIVHEYGVADADVDAAAYSLEPVYQDTDGKKLEKRLGFRVQRRFTVTVRDLSRVFALVSRLSEAGVVSIESVTPDVEQTRAKRDEARLQATRAAREKAQAIAAELGQTLGRAISVEVDGASAYGVSVSIPLNGRNFVALAPLDEGQNLGRITLTARVKVVFDLK
jgi:uncharacterized protein YggE